MNSPQSPRKYQFLSGFDCSYAGSTRAHVLRRHLKQRSKRAVSAKKHDQYRKTRQRVVLQIPAEAITFHFTLPQTARRQPIEAYDNQEIECEETTNTGDRPPGYYYPSLSTLGTIYERRMRLSSVCTKKLDNLDSSLFGFCTSHHLIEPGPLTDSCSSFRCLLRTLEGKTKYQYLSSQRHNTSSSHSGRCLLRSHGRLRRIWGGSDLTFSLCRSCLLPFVSYSEAQPTTLRSSTQNLGCDHPCCLNLG